MKIKQHLVITDTEEFFKGDYHGCFNLFDKPTAVSEWINVCDIDIEVPDDLVDQSYTVALDSLEKAEKAAKDELARIETTKQLLLNTDEVTIKNQSIW